LGKRYDNGVTGENEDETMSEPKARAAIIPVTPFQQNCTLLWCSATMKAAVVDPGGDLPVIRDAIAKMGVSVEKILITHGHIDHAAGAAQLAEDLGVPVEGPHKADEFLLRQLPERGVQFGILDARALTPDRWLDQGDQVRVGQLTFDILHCPGHSPGSVAFINREEGFGLVGDVLFSGSVGRTDLEGGDHATLMASIRDQLLPLDDSFAFICGHGPTSTIGAERASNPYVAEILGG
jgi:glyoxylase-like metal-dependent hydrolase (beta-lactamase superfamily II)